MFNGHIIPIKNGYAELPSKAGLGLELNWDEAKKHPYTPRSPEMYFEDGLVMDH